MKELDILLKRIEEWRFEVFEASYMVLGLIESMSASLAGMKKDIKRVKEILSGERTQGQDIEGGNGKEEPPLDGGK